ncbi:MAG: DUF1933 domain-containing protein, partial [Actinobacteria bacterium]|nr:DUF1933 domain-containing protein [Actinomycetota bacterium]
MPSVSPTARCPCRCIRSCPTEPWSACATRSGSTSEPTEPVCGIAGVLDADGRVDTVSLAAMGHLLEHRGPDDHGLVVDVLGAATAIAVEDGAAPIGGAHLGLAHRRLSIIDPDAGPQPMANDDGSRYITYNGELYNTAELRTWLRARGHRFRTATDTEVVLRAHEELGVRAVDALEGMFAYAVWDRRRGELVVVRDRVGVKPVYLWSSPSRLAFASEVKAFLALDGWRAAADPLHVVEYLTFQNTFGTRTLFSEVRLLEPGHFVVARIRGDRVVTSEHRYWEITADALPAPDRGRPDARDEGEEVRRTFEAVVGSQLVADVP